MPNLRIAVPAAVAALAGVLTLSPVAASAAVGRAPIRFHLTRSHTVSAPATVRPGLVALHNSGRGAIVVLEPRRHATTDDLIRDSRAAKHGSLRLLDDFAVLGVARAHQTLYARLFRGRVLLAGSGGTLSVGSVRTVRVTGAVQNAAVPASSSITLDRGNALSVPATIPTRGLLSIVNASPRVDELLAVQVGTDVSQRTLDEFVAHPSWKGVDGLHPEDIELLGLAPAQHRIFAPYHLSSGRWVVLASALKSPFLARAGGVRALVVR